MASEIRIEEIHFKSLDDNPLGDPAVRRVPVYLPDGYAQNDDRRYPVVYMLAGFVGRGLGMLNDSFFEETIQERMDRLTASGEIEPMIAVLPDGTTRYGGSQYINSIATGNYEDSILELVEYTDSNFMTIPDRSARGVAGKSSGGYGATTLGMRHPDVFGLVADHSGDKYFELCYKPDFAGFLRFFLNNGLAGLQELLSDPPAFKPKGGDFFNALNISAMASCYSPNPAAPLGFDLPFDPETGEIRDAVWAEWEAHDPVEQVERYADPLRSLDLLFFDCGTRDEHNLHYGARIFAERLEALGIPFIHEEFDDGHRGLNYRYDRSLALFSEKWRAL